MSSSFTRSLCVVSCAFGLLASTSVLRADDVTDSIDEAVKAYKANDYATAAQSLDAAAQLIRQKRADQFKALLPDAPSGWQAEDATAQAAAAAMFGGGVSAERQYKKGDATITVKLITDSPIMQGVLMMMGNPMFANADGGKLERIKGQKAIFKNKDGSGSVNVVVNGTLLVQIEGSDVTDADLRAFAEAIDYGKISQLL
ncbi:hypothetical protein [Opitutus terrae]|uniref:Uncharacterized protein n=1 Tax=Opitutus terrae (strain DSM 11246 / JCM 15787 / PB90-1) TaxID=452637 RepID=B1ZXP2_OPITP|nr:hypothetical protein [Opitutus terrae]ACB74264.1 hypothetical protein Oter_0976 [Opitutus terrae PB90-1]